MKLYVNLFLLFQGLRPSIYKKQIYSVKKHKFNNYLLLIAYITPTQNVLLTLFRFLR